MLRCFLKITQHVTKTNQRAIISYSLNSSAYSNVLLRRFSKISNGDSDKESKNKDNITDEHPFGLHDEGDDRLGPLPPQYKRDPITGKFTGEKEEELTEDEEKMLNMSDEELLSLVEGRVMSKNDWDEDEIAKDVRTKDAALNVLGRRVVQDKDEKASTAPLTPSEFSGFKDYLKKEQQIHIKEDDIDVEKKTSTNYDDKKFGTDQDLSWLAKSSTKDAWLEEIMPYDLAPQRKVNRREAKPIPKKLLHHNNLELLRRYSTPGGQILPRAQSRLGAKDQRKIAKLIKRARALGLVPYLGQWKLEDKGDVNGSKEKFWWEDELERKGFILPSRFTDVKKY